MRKPLFLIWFLFPTLLFATERSPWFGLDNVIELRAAYELQTYHRVQTVHGNVHHFARNNFLNLSASFAHNDRNGAEFEILAAETSQNQFSLFDERLTLRHLWLDDVSGDPISLMSGITIWNVQPKALHDINVFYHGRWQFEPFISFGKETSCEQFWSTRWWGLLGLGLANKGSPWIRANFQWEKNTWDYFNWRAFVNTLWGLGDRQLDLDVPFHGYGGIGHRSIDIGAGFSYWLNCFDTTLSADYYYRIYAKNAPLAVQAVKVTLYYPLGL